MPRPKYRSPTTRSLLVRHFVIHMAPSPPRGIPGAARMSDRLPGLFRHDVVVGPERLAFFGDAVFAIAITLLPLDISVPEDLPHSEVALAVREAVPAIGAYLLSFAVIGALWLA